MKKLLTLSCLALLPSALFAQIAINQGTFANWTPGIDTLQKASGVTAMQAMGANQSWDLSAATYLSDTTVVHVADTIATPPSTFYTNIVYAVGDFTLNSIARASIPNDGYKWVAEEVLVRQAYPLIGPGSVNTDSVVFPVQFATYPSPRNILQFPTAFTSTWTSNYVVHTDMLITYGAAGYNSAPAYRNSNVDHHDSLSGWGAMRVKQADGTPSDWIDVIQVQSHRRAVDTFYANNTLIPDGLLAFVGTKQMDTTDSYHIRYYRVGEVTPLADLTYTDDTYTTLEKALIHTSRLPDSVVTSSVADIELANSIAVYPNPAADREITITAKDANHGTWSYQLLNILGQPVAAQPLSFGNGSVRISINKSIPVGTYYIRLARDGRTIATKPVIVQ